MAPALNKGVGASAPTLLQPIFDGNGRAMEMMASEAYLTEPCHIGVTVEKSSSVITDRQILEKFVTPQMMRYFSAKLPTLSSETSALRICEMIKYLILVQYSPGRILFGKEIDDIWHYWILQTREYSQLCESLPGGFFRHHSSNDYVAEEKPVEAPLAEAIERVLSFFISYYANFGPLTAERLECWPPLQVLMEEASWDISELNEFLSDRSEVGQASKEASCA
jgi:hypothetical protein